jgi:hypothetical protein
VAKIKGKARQKIESFWLQDESLSLLLGAVILVVFIAHPFAEIGWLGRPVLTAAGLLILMSGVLVLSNHVFLAKLGAAVGAVNFLVDVASDIWPRTNLLVARALTTLVFLGILEGVLAVRVTREGPVNRYRVQGSILLYMILGLMWSQAYQCIGLLHPDSFAQAIPFQSIEDMVLKLNYFSFVTLTTVGYGDITAVHPFARSLATLEALTGQLFPAILIARLVALQIESQRSASAGKE